MMAQGTFRIHTVLPTCLRDEAKAHMKENIEVGQLRTLPDYA